MGPLPPCSLLRTKEARRAGYSRMRGVNSGRLRPCSCGPISVICCAAAGVRACIVPVRALPCYCSRAGGRDSDTVSERASERAAVAVPLSLPSRPDLICPPRPRFLTLHCTGASGITISRRESRSAESLLGMRSLLSLPPSPSVCLPSLFLP